MRAGLFSAALVLTQVFLGGVVDAQERPQLSDAQAMVSGVADYLGDWRPASLGSVKSWQADLVVAADGSGTHRTVQAALDALPPMGQGVRRITIQLKDGVYREQVCVRGKAPFALVGNPADAAAVTIVQGHYNAEPKRPGTLANPCVPDLPAATYGTAGSASVAIFSDDVQVAHLTVANDAMDAVRDGQGYPAGVGESGGAQAVALMIEGDRVQFENVRMMGHQDTFFVRMPKSGPGRVLVHDSLIAGDVDFIFGNATLVIDASTILSRAGRRVPGNGGHVLAPSTAHGQALGMLVHASRMVGEPGLKDGSISLGRAWDFGVARGAWKPDESPNGQALVRNSALGRHLASWGASTSRRPFTASGPAANRFAEYRNLVLPALEHSMLPTRDGWASAEGGTTGGAHARPGRIVEVHNRAELVAAFAQHGSHPKIIKVRGSIDLSVDDQNRPIGMEAYRDPAFNLEAYVRAYDPKTWGRRAAEGPLEEARRRSVKNQSARVLLHVPSNTTLLGADRDSAIVNGGLFLGSVRNIIIRNIRFSDAYDYFPAWESKDGEWGEWNSEYDNVTLRGGTTHVWVDHCTFDDGGRWDATEPLLLGRRVQRHDGLLDITQRSSYVTVSWNIFRNHDKTALVGSSDTQKLDDGRLRVTFHHNLWEDVKSRAPRVRWGQVHLYNNVYVGRKDGNYPFDYSIGIGANSRIYSERNVWNVPQGVAVSQLAKLWSGDTFFDRDSVLNGQSVDLLSGIRQANPSAKLSADVGWEPRHHLPLDPVHALESIVREGAGSGHVMFTVP